jgi:7,8-dihydro-6-hydroxymethylpterin-pyrophosphokinase
MKGSEFIKLNLKFEILNVGTNVKVKITNLRTAVRQLANTLTVREFKKRIVAICNVSKIYR